MLASQSSRRAWRVKTIQSTRMPTPSCLAIAPAIPSWNPGLVRAWPQSRTPSSGRRRLAHPLGAHDRDGGHTDGGGGDHHENHNDSHASPGGVRVANDGGEDAASSPPPEATSA